MSETTTETSTTDAPKIGIAWGDDISEERQRALDAILAAWDAETDHGERKGPFDSVRLTGADVSWLSERSEHPYHGGAPNLHLEGANLFKALLKGAKLISVHLEGARLRVAQLEGANLSLAHLEGADLRATHLERTNLRYAELARATLGRAHLEHADLRWAQADHADLSEAHLEDADLSSANLKKANLGGAHLERANLGGVQVDDAALSAAQLEGANLSGASLKRVRLSGAQLQRANLRGAQLEQADLHGVPLEGANLNGAHLAGANLSGTQLRQADLRSACFDRETLLHGANLAGISLDQVVFDHTNLTVISWNGVAPLGDEGRARATRYDEVRVEYDPRLRTNKVSHVGDLKRFQHRIEDYEAAVRANRLLATALRAQGLAGDADVFAYRAQIMQRGLRFQQRQFARWLGSWLLALLAGYGYRIWRILLVYVLVVLAFALAYYLTGFLPTEHVLSPDEAVVMSITTIHGRVFTSPFNLDSIQAKIAAGQAVIRLAIEGVFVAMIIQRLLR